MASRTKYCYSTLLSCRLPGDAEVRGRRSAENISREMPVEEETPLFILLYVVICVHTREKCIYVHMYVCLYVHIYIHIYIYMFIFLCIQIREE